MDIIFIFFTNFIADWRVAFATENYLPHLAGAVAFFVVALIAEIYGAAYTKKVAPTAPSLSDIILDKLPVVNLNFLFVETMGAMMTIFCVYQFTRPLAVPYTFATLALFTLIRRGFLLMTPFGPHKNMLVGHGFLPHRVFAHKLLQGDGDYFFSGHTGLPFLFFFLTPWQPLAIIFLIGSVCMAAAVLLMHVHYSIDVFAAPFIVYSIFALSKILFL